MNNKEDNNGIENQAKQSADNNGLKGDNTVKNPDDWTTGDEPM
ncbi:MAG: DUF3072 domain-containing protein, partial [Chitinophagaceae bacterium]